MAPSLEADILAASQSLRIPGSGEQRVLSPVAVQRLAETAGLPRWELEALALEVGITPLHYMRNLAQFRSSGQVRLLRSTAGLVGDGPIASRALELLALSGVGRFLIRVPLAEGLKETVARERGERLAGGVRRRNASAEVQVGVLRLKQDRPADALPGVGVVGACLQDSLEEQLLQFSCRMLRVPMVLGGGEGNRGQATTVFPGDPGVALIYKPAQPHLEPRRRGAEVGAQAGLMVGTWLAEQMTRILLDEGELLRNRLLYADLDRQEIREYPLGG